MQSQARITSKGQVTVPAAIRRALGVSPGDSLIFDEQNGEVKIHPIRKADPFEKYRGIGIPGAPRGKKAFLNWFREFRGR